MFSHILQARSAFEHGSKVGVADVIEVIELLSAGVQDLKVAVCRFGVRASSGAFQPENDSQMDKALEQKLHKRGPHGFGSVAVGRDRTFGDRLDDRYSAVLVTEVLLHCSGCLGSAIAEIFAKRIDALNMGALATDQNNTLRASADLVHTLRPLSLFSHSVLH